MTAAVFCLLHIDLSGRTIIIDPILEDEHRTSGRVST